MFERENNHFETLEAAEAIAFAEKGFAFTTIGRHTPESFFLFCLKNPALRVELEPDGKLNIMPPVSTEGVHHEFSLAGELHIYVRTTKNGRGYGPSTGFTLPDGSVRSPDASWLSDEKAALVAGQKKEGFASVVPDFVIELRSSKKDSLADLKEKMSLKWIKNGVRLGWLIDPVGEKSWIYRADGSVEEHDGFDRFLSGEEVLPGFELDLRILRD